MAKTSTAPKPPKLTKAPKAPEAPEASAPVDTVGAAPAAVETVSPPAPAMTEEQREVAESRLALKNPLAAGQMFFESPEGFIVVGEADRAHVWCRKANKGRGMWINPRRAGGA